MHIKGKGEKLFGTIVLILMTVLALSTITLAAARSNSYSLTIHKIANVEGELPEGITLAGRECKFRVEGILGGRGGTEGTPFTKEVTVTLDEHGEGSTKVDLGSPGSISVVELNPNTANTLLTNAVALTEISNESHMHVNSSNPKAEIDLSKENSWITIKPDASDSNYPVQRAYKITGNGTEYKRDINDGESETVENLSPGHYTIEAQKAPAGFGLLVTNPRIESEAGKKLAVNIDSNSGEGLLTIADDGNTHYFKVEGPNGYEDNFVLPYKDESGNQQFSYKVQHVVEGQYTMYEESYKGQAAFTVYAPKTTYTTQATKNYTFKENTLSRWNTTASTNKNDYIRLYAYDIEGVTDEKKLTVRVKGTFLDNQGERTREISYNYKPGNTLLCPITPYATPGKDILFRFANDAGVTGCKIDIRLYQPRVYYYTSNEGTDKIVTVDDRRYIEIEKPNDSGAQAGQVTYYFTISDKDGNVVTVTDSNGSSMTEVEVAPGKRLKVNVPAAGNYTVHQKMKKISPAPFVVSTRCQQSTTLQDATLTASIAGTDSTIQMSKPACEDGIDDLGREYHFRVTGPSLPTDGAVVALKSGESFTLRKLLENAGLDVPENYETGQYSISAIDGGYAGFDLTYSDSCTLDVVSSSATVTVTNTYKKALGAYRVVHEYYDGDVSTPDAENFDGRSEISLFGNENLDTEHTGDEITKEYLYQKDDVKYTYEYVDTVYGNYGEFVEDASTPTPTPSPTSEPDSALVSDEEGKENENEKEDGESNGELAESPQPVSTPDSSPDPEDGNQGEEGKEDSGQDGDNQENGSQENGSQEKDDQEHDGQDGNNQEGEGGNDNQEDINAESSAPVPAFVPVLKTDIISVQNMAYKMEPMAIRLKAETVLYGEMPKDSAESRNMDNEPTEQPKPTPEPTLESDPKPTPEPTSEPTIEPTSGPTIEPTAEPTPGPAIEPTVEPTGEPADETKPEESPVPGKEEQEAEKIGQDEINAEISGDIMLLNDTSDKIFVDTGEYAMDEGMTCAVAKPHGDNIIILRYKRVKKQEQTKGSYHIVHRYYHRTPNGDIFEGAYDEGVIDAPLDFSKQYTADTVEKRLKHTPPQNLIPNAVPHTYTYEFSVYGYYKPSGNGEPAAYEDGYRPIDGKECAYATENGEEAIVLRYYRNEAAYNVVHEYYLRTPVDISKSSTTLNEGSVAGGSEGADGEGNSGENEGSDSEDGGESDIAYDYTFEGNTDVTMYTGILNDTYTGLRVEKIPEYSNRLYTHFQYDYGKLKQNGGYEDIDGKDSVTATMKADEVIILRYYREVGGSGTPTPTPPPTNPGKPEHPKPTDEPEPPDEPEPTEAPQPTGSPKPTGSPTPGNPSPSPENPGYPTELPDPNDPDSPEEITIWEDGVSKTYVKLWNPEIEEWVYILDSEIPLWYFPDTGDGSGIGFWAVMCIISLCGMTLLVRIARKRKNT